MSEIIELDGKRYTTGFPNSLEKYLKENAKRVSGKTPSEIKESLSALAPLIPIAIGIGAGAIATWVVNKEQKEQILKEYLEPL